MATGTSWTILISTPRFWSSSSLLEKPVVRTGAVEPPSTSSARATLTAGTAAAAAAAAPMAPMKPLRETFWVESCMMVSLPGLPDVPMGRRRRLGALAPWHLGAAGCMALWWARGGGPS